MTGFVLMVAGFAAAGMGHGCYVVMGGSSSPFALVNNVAVAMFSTPVVWGVLGALACSTSRGGRMAFLAAMAAHYLALMPILTGNGNFSDWDYMHRQGDMVYWAVVLGAVVYGCGHIGLWTAFLLGLPRRGPAGVCTKCQYSRAGLPPNSPCPECGQAHGAQ